MSNNVFYLTYHTTLVEGGKVGYLWMETDFGQKVTLPGETIWSAHKIGQI